MLAGGCAGPRPADHFGVRPDNPSEAVAGMWAAGLTERLFAPPQEATTDRFDSAQGVVTRVRTKPDETGAWTISTTGPNETSTLTLQRTPDGSVCLLRLVADGRTMVCDPGLTLEPGEVSLPHAAESACTIDGRPGTARARLDLLAPPEDEPTGPDDQWVRLELVFDAPPVTARRRFDWRTTPGVGIVEERATLEVTFLGVGVRRRDRVMTRAAD